MAKRKERTLEELYNATENIAKPEITPVLRGSCRMQGPVDETDYDPWTNTVSSRSDKGFSGHSMSQKVLVRAESGTCNVCSAPCSSCLHINRALMASKTDESSDGTSRENTFSYSVNDVIPTVKGTSCEIGQHAASETSNLVSVNSSHDSFSENAESKANLRNSDVSVAFEDVEISPKLSSGGTVREDQHTSVPQSASDKRNLTNKFEDPIGLEGHDDNISCVSRANEANKLSSFDIGNKGRINLPHCSASADSLVSEGNGKTVPYQAASVKCDIEGSQNNSTRQSNYSDEYNHKVHPSISLSTDLAAHNSSLMENPSSKDTEDGAGRRNVESKYVRLLSGKSLSSDPNVKDLEVDSCSRLQGEPPECSREHLSSLTTKDVVSDTVSGQKSTSYTCDDMQNSEVGLGGKSEASMEICLKLEAQADDAGNLPGEALNSVEQNQEVGKVRESLILPDAKETSLRSHPSEDSDESDIVEHDVKVCDICGDAGREDLLAVCCRCSDGAEHTYCMREMLDKVPESDWLCEECRFDEDIKNQKQDKFGSVDGVEKNQSSGQTSSDNANLLRLKPDAKVSDVEGNKSNKDHASAKVSGKRHADDTEVSSIAKKQALEPSIRSPKTSSPSRIGAISRDSSFKNLDRGKVKPAHQFPSSIHSVDDAPEVTCAPTIGPRLQTPRGTFLKANSFNFSNAKPKVKLVDDVPQKQKSSKESASLDIKEGAGRVISKSMSFKSVNSGRLNTGESKVKMLSPKLSSPVQDLKSLKHSKERNFFERKNSFKSDRPLVNSTIAGSTVSTLKVDKKPASRGETGPISSTSNSRELKAQSESKSVPLSKPTNHVIRRGSEMHNPLGEVKRQLSRLPSVIGASSANGISSSVEQKPLQAISKDDSMSNSCNAERSLGNVNESLPDGLPRPRELTNLAERIKESSTSRAKQSTTPAGRSVPCQKCKETDHSSQFCTVDSARSLALDASTTARSSREVMNKGNKLKAAIQAAMLKKPGIYRKNKVSDQSDELSMSNTNCEIAFQDQMSSNLLRNTIPAEDVNEGQAIPQNSSADSGKQTTSNSVKHFPVLPVEAVTPRTGDASPMASSDGKPFMTDLLGHASVTMPVLWNLSAIPEHEYIWQGSFEVHRSGKNPDICDGFQAHLSTCASPRVLEAVNKFPRKVLLTEVPRLSTWPVQFEESGVKEENIALYFFAKDLESFEKSYKILLDSMLRSDLALKGNIDGVELLIFPSNQLPEKSQRWNMLYYLWGVFRGKRVNCSQQVPCSPKKLSSPLDSPTAFMSLPDNICSLRPIEKDLPMLDRACDVAANAPALIDLPCLSSTETINVDCDTNVSSFVPKVNFLQINVEQRDCRPDSNSLSPIRKSSVQSCQKEGLDDSDCKPNAEIHASVQDTRTIIDSNKSEKMPIPWDTPLEGHQASSQYVNKVSAVRSVSAENIVDRINSRKDEVKYRKNPEADESLDAEEGTQGGEAVLRVPNTKELNIWHFNHRKRPYLDPTDTVSRAPFAGTSQNMSWNDINSSMLLVDGGNVSKKPKTGFGGVYGCNDYTSSSRDSFAPRIHDLSSSSPIKETQSDEVFDEVAIPKDSGNAERYFFPVDPHPVKDFGLGHNSIPWLGFSPANEDRLRDRAPNLELALGGAETKPSKPELPPFLLGKVDRRNNQDQPSVVKVAATKEEEDDDVSASLSLSLSFPFPDKDRAMQTVTKREQQLLPERRHVNPSLLLFGSFSDK